MGWRARTWHFVSRYWWLSMLALAAFLLREPLNESSVIAAFWWPGAVVLTAWILRKELRAVLLSLKEVQVGTTKLSFRRQAASELRTVKERYPEQLARAVMERTSRYEEIAETLPQEIIEETRQQLAQIKPDPTDVDAYIEVARLSLLGEQMARSNNIDRWTADTYATTSDAVFKYVSTAEPPKDSQPTPPGHVRTYAGGTRD